jgi:hypothetical protein
VAKLTLSVNGSVVSRAKQYAKQRGVSVSQMVETYLAAVAAPSSPALPDCPVLSSLRGSLKKADLKDYQRHVAAKYR